MSNLTRLNILNIWVDPVSRIDALARVRHFLAYGRQPHCVFASNPEKNYSVPADPELYRIYRKADLLLPDGIGVVLTARLLHGIRLERVPGSEFIFEICRLAQSEGYRVFVYGAKETVSRDACRKLEERFPGVQVVGRSNGYVPQEKLGALIDAINESKAYILFVALGSPRQEKWIVTYADRLAKEPHRIKRQKVLPFFAFEVMKEWAKGKNTGARITPLSS